MSAASAYLSTFGTKTETEAEIRSTSKQVISEVSLSKQSVALVLTDKKTLKTEKPRIVSLSTINTHKKTKIQNH